MNKTQKWIALALCVSMLLSGAALAEDTTAPEVTQAVAVTAPELMDTDVLATVNGQPVTWAECKVAYNSYINQYGSYYDMTLKENVDLFRAVALSNAINLNVIYQQGVTLGLDQLTAEEIATAEQNAQSDWDSVIEQYIASAHSELTDESTDEEKAAANDEAVKYFNDMGYSPEILKSDYVRYAVLDKVEAYATQDVVVTDADVEAAYQALVEADKKLYENNIDAYIEYNNYVDQMGYYSMMYGGGSEMDHAWYKPAGFRAVKHILLHVDDALMTTYTDLLARYEEQQEATETEATEPAAEATDAAAEPTAEPTATPEPVTEEQVNAAKAAILESLAAKTDEIYQKIADGADFDALIAEYAVDAEGNPTDGGMTAEPYKTSGYEVAKGSTNYVPEFVEAAFSVDNIGEVSAPYISTYGVHILKYIDDVAAGPVAMTDAQRTAKLESMLTTQKSEAYSAKLQEWVSAATIEYTGLVPSMAEVEAATAAAEETEVATEEEAQEQVAEGEGEAVPAE